MEKVSTRWGAVINLFLVPDDVDADLLDWQYGNWRCLLILWALLVLKSLSWLPQAMTGFANVFEETHREQQRPVKTTITNALPSELARWQGQIDHRVRLPNFLLPVKRTNYT